MIENNPHKPKPDNELSLELNFRSFLAGEGAPFFQAVPVEEMCSFAAVGSPVTVPESMPYSHDDLLQIAAAVSEGGTTLTLVGAGRYPAELLEQLEKQSNGRLRRA